MKVAYAVAVAAVACGGIALLQAPLARDLHAVTQREDVVIIPPPDELRLATLGYDAAAVDYLWGKLLVEYGTHVHEKRPLDVPRYLDAILVLEEDYRPLYRYVDTLLVYRPPRGTEDDARLARKYLVRGTEVRPYDHEVWMHYGQFVAFLAPSFLSSDAEKDKWREEGARAVARAVELGGDADRSLSAASILSRYGDRDATVRHLRRAYALTEEPQIRESILAKLQAMEANAEKADAEQETKVFDAQRRRAPPFLKFSEFRPTGPYLDTAQCAGLDATTRVECATSWSDLWDRRKLSRGE